MNEEEWAEGNPCRGVEGSEPSKVIDDCHNCGRRFERKIGHFVRCPECGKFDFPKYTKKFIDCLRAGLYYAGKGIEEHMTSEEAEEDER